MPPWGGRVVARGWPGVANVERVRSGVRMALSYDFDITSVIPTDMMTEPRAGSFAAEIGAAGMSPENFVALFRKQETVDALNQAPEDVRELLVAAGWGRGRAQSDMPDGTYPTDHKELRAHFLGRLVDTLEERGWPEGDDGGSSPDAFKLRDFMSAALAAQPVDLRASVTMADISLDLDDDIASPPRTRQRSRRRREREAPSKRQRMIAFAMAFAAYVMIAAIAGWVSFT